MRERQAIMTEVEQLFFENPEHAARSLIGAEFVKKSIGSGEYEPSGNMRIPIVDTSVGYSRSKGEFLSRHRGASRKGGFEKSRKTEEDRASRRQRQSAVSRAVDLMASYE